MGLLFVGLTAMTVLASPYPGLERPRALTLQSSWLGIEGSSPEVAAAADPSGGFDFNLLPAASEQPAPVDAKLEKAIKTRRSMLELHQGFGIATVVLMAATVVVGQLNYSDRFGGGSGTGRFELLHDSLASVTTLTFATAGLLALLAPVPLKKTSEGIDTITIHKWSMLGASLGMATEIALGILTASREGFANQPSLATTHLVIGYATAGFLGTGVAALFFQ